MLSIFLSGVVAERIRQLLVTILKGHPLGVVMLLHSGNDQIRFKPRPVEGVALPAGTEADWLLLDGQQRLTSPTQALTGDGVVATKDSRGKLLQRRHSSRTAGASTSASTPRCAREELDALLTTPASAPGSSMIQPPRGAGSLMIKGLARSVVAADHPHVEEQHQRTEDRHRAEPARDHIPLQVLQDQ